MKKLLLFVCAAILLLLPIGCKKTVPASNISTEHPLPDAEIIRLFERVSRNFFSPEGAYSYEVWRTFAEDVLPGNGKELIAFIECEHRNIAEAGKDHGMGVAIFRLKDRNWQLEKSFRVPVSTMRSECFGSLQFMDIDDDGLLDFVGTGHVWHKQEQTGFSSFIVFPSLNEPVISLTEGESWLDPKQEIEVIKNRDGITYLVVLTMKLELGTTEQLPDTKTYHGGRIYQPVGSIEVFKLDGSTVQEETKANPDILPLRFQKQLKSLENCPSFEENKDINVMAARIPWGKGCWSKRLAKN